MPVDLHARTRNEVILADPLDQLIQRIQDARVGIGANGFAVHGNQVHRCARVQIRHDAFLAVVHARQHKVDRAAGIFLFKGLNQGTGYGHLFLVRLTGKEGDAAGQLRLLRRSGQAQARQRQGQGQQDT